MSDLMRIRATQFLTTHHPILAAYCNPKTRDALDIENAVLALTHLLEGVRIQERDRIAHMVGKEWAKRITRPP